MAPNTSKKGFAIGTILLAVALIAVIISAVSVASRGSTSSADKEKSVIDASMLVNQVINIQNALARYATNGYGNFSVLNSMNELIDANWLQSGFGQLSNNPTISPWMTATEVNADPVIGRYLQFPNDNFIVRLKASKQLCLAVLTALHTSFNTNSYDNQGNNGEGNSNIFGGCTYSLSGVPHCPTDPVVTVTVNAGDAKFAQSGGVMGPTCVDLTDLSRDPSIGDYIIIGYIKP